jgi:hypothetical protein
MLSVSRMHFMLSVIMLSVIMLSAIMLNVVILSFVMLSATYAECHYAACHYAECRYAECGGALSMCILVIVMTSRGSTEGRAIYESPRLESRC